MTGLKSKSDVTMSVVQFREKDGEEEEEEEEEELEEEEVEKEKSAKGKRSLVVGRLTIIFRGPVLGGMFLSVRYETGKK